MANRRDPRKALIEAIASFYDDPLGCTMFLFPWSTDKTIQFAKLQEPWKSRFGCDYGPDVWFCEMCDEITAFMRANPLQPPIPVDPFRYAVKSGHGIGKSAGVAFITWWLMNTHPFCVGTITANSLPQLKTKTWPELTKWYDRMITKDDFVILNSSQNRTIYRKGHKDTWHADAQSSVKENSEAFAGQHNASSTSFYIFDEASGIDNKIWEVAEGGMTDGEPYLFAFGNPVRNSGYFREIWRKFRKQWHRQSIDSREVQITNKKKLADDIATHGLDSDFARVRILGKFPESSSNQKIPYDILQAAFDRDTSWLRGDAKVMSLDVARGGDDNCVFAFRHGMHASSFKRVALPGADYRDSMKLVAKCQYFYEKFQPDYFFIDSTGVGGPVSDRLNQLGINNIAINFASASPDPHFANMRAYMADRFLQWLKNGGCLPFNEELEIETGAVEYTYDGKNREILIPKDQIKKEIGVSTDYFDAEMLLHAMPTPAKMDHVVGVKPRNDIIDPGNYNPFQSTIPYNGFYHPIER